MALPGAAPEVHLALQGVRKAYGSTVVIRDVSLDIAAGELFVLLGPSGSGKTTLLRLVAGLLAPDAGTIRLGGRDITALPPHRRSAPMVFQDHLLFPHLTVAENVAFGLRMRGCPDATSAPQVRRHLAEVGLAEYGGRYPAQLSGGQKQRVALARTLVLNPQVLLLDEPFSSLDPSLRHEMRQLLRAVQREHGVTAVLVTHDQEEAFSLGSQVAVLMDGRVAQVGTPEALWFRPASAAVAGFLGAANVLPGRIDGGRFFSPGLGPNGLPAGHARRSDGPALAVLRPEAVRVLPADAARGWPAIVVESRFAGGACLYRLAAGAVAVTARVPSAPGGPLPPETPVQITWDPTAAWYVDP